MPAPNPQGEVEELQSPRARIAPELNFGEPRRTDAVEQALAALGHVWLVDAYNVRARSAEIRRVLAQSPRDDRCNRLAREAGSRERHLGVTAARDQLLDHDGVRRNEFARLVVE